MNPVVLGPYTLTLESKGIKVSHAEIVGKNMLGMGGGSGFSPSTTLYFSLNEAGNSDLIIPCHRLHQESEAKVSFHGSIDDRIALDVDIEINPSTMGLKLKCHLESSRDDITARLGIHLEMPSEADPKWLIPGLFYNQNKPHGCEQLYPSYSEIRRDSKRFVSNHWNFRADRTAMPLVCCTTYGMMTYLTIEERTAVSEAYPEGRGIASLGFSGEEGHPVINAHAPYLEEPVKFSFCHENKTEAEQTFIQLAVNDTLLVECEVGMRPIPEEGVAWHDLYRALYQQKATPISPRPRLNWTASENLAIDGMQRWHFDKEHTLLHETCAFDRRFGNRGKYFQSDEMHVGWTSGVFPAFTLLWHGRDRKVPDAVYSAQAVLTRITSDLSPAGTLWPIHSTQGVGAGFGPKDGLAHSRTIAESVLFLIRAYRLELKSATLHPKWFWAIQSNLTFALKNQDERGAFPSYWDVESGEVLDHEGCAGLTWIAAMAAFDHLDPTNQFRDAAVLAGEHYAQFIDEDFLYGSVEDQPLVPTCDDCHLAVIAYTLLYECDRDHRWLELAKRAAELALTFRMAYNVYFAPFSILGQTRFQTFGGDVGSVSQPVLSPRGLISYGEMKKLSALTKDSYFEERALEARIFATQLIARGDGEYNARQGMAVGEIFYTDWLQPKGMVSSIGHIWSLSIIAHTELVDRNMVIPMAALDGDEQSIENAMNYASGMIENAQEIVMPSSVDDIRRRSKDSINTDVDEFRRQNGTGIIRRPVTTIGTNPNLTPFSEALESEGLPPNLSSIMGSSFQDEGSDTPRRMFARTPTESDQKRQDSWNFAPNRTPRESQAEIPKIPRFDTPKPTSPAQHKRPAPRDEDHGQRTSRHTPLSSDSIDIGGLTAQMNKSLLSEPTPAPTSRSSQSGDEKPKMKRTLAGGDFDPLGDREKEKSSDLGPPPAHLMQGLLSNLMDDSSDGPIINPKGDVDYGAYEESSSDKKEKPKSKSDDDDQEIKYKIF